MSARTATVDAPDRPLRGGTRIMLTTHWRSGRRALLIWVIAMVGLFAATAWSLDSVYDTPAKIAEYAAGVSGADSSTLAINGTAYGVDNIGGVIAYEFGFMSAIAVPLMGVLLIARWTRREEESGRLEMIRAGVVSRRAPLAAALIWTTAAFAVMAVGYVLSLVPIGISWADATAYALSQAALGLWFAAIAALAAQAAERTRGVYAASIGVLALAFVLRGVGDVEDNFLTWLSPLGWTEETRAFADTRWWPIALTLALAALIIVAAFVVLERRDLGSGVLVARPGAPTAGALVRNSFGLAARMHRNIVLGWAVVAVLVGGSFGSVIDAIEDVASDNDTLQDVMAGGSDQADAFVAFVVMIVALVIGGYAMEGASRISEEERGGRLEPVLAGSLGRLRWLLGHGIAICVGAVVVTLAGGAALGAGVAASESDGSQFGRMLGATFAYLPAMLVLAALAVLLYAAKPSLQPIGWAAYAYVAVVAILGDTLRLPDWAMNISPMNWVGRVPTESAETWALVVALVVVCAFAAASALALRGRDIPST
ncbi:hypothetical protein L0C25_12785 [Solicola gregarius]|uniref:ABC-2 type transport system permease protein n=1 Tax=Solicola gregarius TaxID=2908642 RepID=A0AA46YJW9_9ACTN|nr:hypothetical protein [Solicola gregarius]UYM03433.1 hypothetical protein L0C25_12785 [Solicola gregarius]